MKMFGSAATMSPFASPKVIMSNATNLVKFLCKNPIRKEDASPIILKKKYIHKIAAYRNQS